MRDRGVARERGDEEGKRKGVQTVTAQEMTDVTCAQLSLRTDQNVRIWMETTTAHQATIGEDFKILLHLIMMLELPVRAVLSNVTVKEASCYSDNESVRVKKVS